MGQIYRKSTHLAIWLGEGDEQTNTAMQFVKTINIETFDQLARNKQASNDWAAFYHLMKQKGFSRRWIVQAIALAPDAKLYCGKEWVKWTEDRDQAISRALHQTSTSGFRPDFLGAINSLAATSNLFRGSNLEGQPLSLLSFETLISNLTLFEASNAHDTFYAVINLAKDAYPSTKEEEKMKETIGDEEILGIKRKSAQAFTQRAGMTSFVVNYERPFFDVCKDFLECVFRREKSLDIICRPWIPEDAEFYHDGPSCLRSTAETAYRSRGDGAFVRAQADSLVGSTILGRQNYNASKLKDALKDWNFHQDENGYGLVVKGFIVDHVSEEFNYSMSGNIPPEWLIAGGWKGKNKYLEPPDALWRTLVGDRGSDGLNPPEHWPLALSAALNQSVRGSPINTTSLVDNPNTDTAVREFLRRAQEVIWSRSLIKTRHGHLGLAHQSVRDQDCISILFGCSVPVVLRPLNRGDGDSKYRFVGECYVHDLMEGEAYDLARQHNNRNIPEQEFELR